MTAKPLILGRRHTNGGETVCTTRDCQSCAGRVCIAGFQACQAPEPDPEPPAPRIRFPLTPEGGAGLVGALLGLAGFLYLAAAVLRHLST